MTAIEKLRALRENTDLTQQYVADYLGTSQTMYARYEREANEMPVRHLRSLCLLYNVSADFILDSVPDKKREAGKIKKRH